MKFSLKKTSYKKDINKAIIDISNNLRTTGEFIEQRRPSAALSFLGLVQSQRLTVKSRSTGARRFVFLPIVDGNMYEVVVTDLKAGIDPSNDAMYFMALIYLTGEPGGAQAAIAAAGKWKPADTGIVARHAADKDTGSSQTADTVSHLPPEDTSIAQGEVPLRDSEASFIPAGDIPLVPGDLIKAEIPLVKFSATDPCAPENNVGGMPWDKVSPSSSISVPPGGPAVTPPAIPDFKTLSQATYNAAVSIAFEGMRLVYGPMPDAEAQRFEAAWAPLFDYPTQEIVDYLNKLNSLLGQFLSLRESFIRTLNDIQFVLFDAAIAVELEDRYAWEAIMAEAAIYASVTRTLDASMKKLASMIESLGAPPDPIEAKCEAARRYRRMLPKKQTGNIGECWAGYTKSDVQVPELSTLFEPILRHVSPFNGGYIMIELDEDGPISNLESDGDWISHIRVRQIDADYLPEEGMRIDEGEIGKFDYPNIIQYNNTSHFQLLTLSEQSNVTESYENYAEMRKFSNMCKQYLSRLQTAGFFFKRGILWSYHNRWDNYPLDEHGQISEQAFIDFEEEMQKEMADYLRAEELQARQRSERKKELDEKHNIDSLLTQEKGPSESDSPAITEQQIREEAIAYHNEMVNVIRHNLDREITERNETYIAMYSAKTPAERENLNKRIKDFDLRIMQLQSNMQDEKDKVSYNRTGQVVRTRTVFDEYARHAFIDSIRVDAARRDATKRMADRMDLLIRNLPEEDQAKAREFAHKNLDPETLASGDIKKALKVRAAIHQQVLGHAMLDGAKAEEAAVDAEQNQFYSQMAIVALGAVTVGMGSSALASTYGAQAATTYYGTKTLGAVWGATTGYQDGGIKGSVSGAISYWSPLGSATVQFIDGFQRAGRQPNADISSRVWEGTKQAGTGYLIGKAFELGASLAAKGALVAFGQESWVFKPIIQSPSSKTRQMLDGMRKQQQTLNARSEVKTFQRLESELALLKRDPVANHARIAEMEKQLNQLASGMNMNYFTKWEMKYKAHPLVRSKFASRVKANYDEMTPGMTNRLEKMGYRMENIEFLHLRNSSSAGSSSMDLDLAPFYKGTKQQLKNTVIRKRDGSFVTLEQFQTDAQNAMNAEYYQITGMSATASGMQVTTKIHPEAFSSPGLLDHKLDFSTLTPDEVASVGKVLRVKMDGINKNQMLTNTTKMQAKAREASKEIENMLLRKLNSDLGKAAPGSSQHRQLQRDIRYWEDMLQRLKTIGMEETNPSTLMQLNREIMHETGGSDVNVVINDLINRFK